MDGASTNVRNGYCIFHSTEETKSYTQRTMICML